MPGRAALCAAMLAGTVAVYCPPSAAGDWLTTFGVTHQTTYENNPQLGQNGRQSNTLNEVSPSVLSAYESETYALDLDLSGTLVRSRNKQVTGDTTRLNLNASNDFDFDTIRVFSAAALSRSAAENTEFNNNELTTDAASASVTNDEVVEEMSLSSRIEWDISDRTFLFGTHERRETRFDGGDSDSFVNNEFTTGATVFVNDRFDIGPTLAYTRFEPDEGSGTTLIRADLVGNYQFSDNALTSISAGILDFENERDLSLDAEYQHRIEKATLTFGLSRSVSPGNNSQLDSSDSATFGLSYSFSGETEANLDAQYRETDEVEAQQLGLSLLHIFSDKVSVGIDLDWTETTDIGGDAESVTDEYRADPFLAWQINEDVNARLSYRELQRRETDQETVRSRRVTFSISYSKQYD